MIFFKLLVFPGDSCQLSGKYMYTDLHRSSRLDVFSKGVLQLYYKKTLARVFSCEFCKISKTTFFTEPHRTTASICTQANIILATLL